MHLAFACYCMHGAIPIELQAPWLYTALSRIVSMELEWLIAFNQYSIGLKTIIADETKNWEEYDHQSWSLTLTVTVTQKLEKVTLGPTVQATLQIDLQFKWIPSFKLLELDTFFFFLTPFFLYLLFFFFCLLLFSSFLLEFFVCIVSSVHHCT